jgi:hypothetical protein
MTSAPRPINPTTPGSGAGVALIANWGYVAESDVHEEPVLDWSTSLETPLVTAHPPVGLYEFTPEMLHS